VSFVSFLPGGLRCSPLGDGHIDQLIESVSLYQIQSFLKLGIQASTKMITFAGISVRMIIRILAQVIEDLCILHDGAGSLGQIQKFIELSLNESFGNVVRSKSGPKFIPGNNMTNRLHGMVVVPPYAGSAVKLLGCEEGLVLI
jgi:hypothetical protein